VQQNGYDPDWAKVDVHEVPRIKVKPPGPRSRAIQQRSEKYMQGYSSQAHLFPVAFESGNGVILTDVDGNQYIDFSSGIYVTNWGHCHPKITEAVVEYTASCRIATISTAKSRRGWPRPWSRSPPAT